MLRRRIMFGATALTTLPILTACASWRSTRLDTNYRRPDAGMLVMGLGAESWLLDACTVKLRRLPETTTPNPSAPLMHPQLGQLTFTQQDQFGRKAMDYDHGLTHGVVLTAALPPGRYEFYNFEATERLGTEVSTFTAPQDFQIAFTIQPGQTTYLGRYKAHHLPDRYFASRTPSMGIVFVVSDQASEDLAIASHRYRNRRRSPSQVSHQVPDPDRLGGGIFHRPGMQPRTVSLSILKRG